MNHKSSPDNHIRRVMDASLPGLEDDLWFEERVLRRIREAEQKTLRTKRKHSHGFIIALALVLMTAAAVGVSLRHRTGGDQQVIAAADNPRTPDQAASVVTACGHGDTAIESVRRHAYLNDREHKYVETTYSLCKTCGRVFWSHDETLFREAHQPDATGEKEEIRGITVWRYATCELCHQPCYSQGRYAERDEIILPTSAPKPTQVSALKPSELAGCGHEKTTTGWARRYTPIGINEHKLVDTYYSMCVRCGEVFWTQDATLLREAHDETMALYTLEASDTYTCKYCYAQWCAQEE